MCDPRRISILPPNLANQIAAGEVVERPASVVKELVENALDAGAREVRIETEEGGRRLIRVSDDGEGMGPEDARTAFERHATSKIRSAEDLRAVSSYGFRGEALPSIASVARVRLVTKRRSDAVASDIRITGGRFENQAEAGAPEGTLVEVADLFFNTPARRKFLRHAAAESSRVSEVVLRLALARPDAGFTLLQGGRVALEARAGAPLQERIIDVLGGAMGADLVPVDFRSGAAEIQGFISPPDRTQPTARSVYLFVNERPVSDRSLQHALLSAARDFIPQNRFPVAVIQMQIPAEAVDENVHPAKLEVRFREPRAVYDALRRAILDSLRGWSAVGFTGGAPAGAFPGNPRDGVQEPLARYLATTGSGGGAEAVDSAGSGEHALPLAADLRGQVPSEGGAPPSRFLGQAHETYLLFESGSGILIVDQHAAHERLVFERIRRQMAEGGIAQQPLLVPRTIELSPGRRSSLWARRAEIEKMGFDLEPFGGDTMAVKAVPALLEKVDLQSLLESVADDLEEENGAEAAEKAIRRALATMACHASIRAGQRLDRAQAEALQNQLEEAGSAGTCPHGRPVAVRLPRADLERLFRRT